MHVCVLSEFTDSLYTPPLRLFRCEGEKIIFLWPERDTERQRERQRETERDRERDTERHRERHRETERETQRDRERDRERGARFVNTPS